MPMVWKNKGDNDMKTKYNTTQLDPDKTFERHVYHRDQFAHYLRWTHVLKRARIGMNILDFGCGTSMNLGEVLYRNRFKCNCFIGIDIRSLNKKGYDLVYKTNWMHFHQQDLCGELLTVHKATDWDLITSFEVIEHVGKENTDKFLKNIHSLCSDKTTVLLSTPIYDEKVGAADNHIIDGVVGEYTYEELKGYLEKYFTIEETYGTFASQRDYKPLMNEWQTKMFNELNKYYDANLISNIMAPLFPKQSRNCMWVLKKK